MTDLRDIVWSIDREGQCVELEATPNLDIAVKAMDEAAITLGKAVERRRA